MNDGHVSTRRFEALGQLDQCHECEQLGWCFLTERALILHITKRYLTRDQAYKKITEVHTKKWWVGRARKYSVGPEGTWGSEKTTERQEQEQLSTLVAIETFLSGRRREELMGLDCGYQAYILHGTEEH